MHFGVSTFVTDEGIAPVALGRALEERGLDSLFLAEHTHIPASRETPYPAGGELPRMYYGTLDPFLTLAAVAAVTSRLRLGTGIALVVERDPITTAKEVATLDLISGGRADFGIGAGWNLEEMRNHGTDPHTRGQLLDERVRAMRELWTKEVASFDGELVRIEPSYCWPKPVQQPHPPIWVGGNSPRTFRRIAEYGVGWLVVGLSPGQLVQRIAELREVAGPEKQVLVYLTRHQEEQVDEFLKLDVAGVLFQLPTVPEEQTMPLLDRFAELAAARR
ncbi:LLM class F420-dependent oxidoreductase [Kitasatospora cystarginea]|uniref:LLM class F420-dependent oxidoreductase n=1 Tax=Kitasatospora cystarginea TaxID=58350 RepID=A0ABP5R7Q3_9ACTN